jgi:hypothetical protein
VTKFARNKHVKEKKFSNIYQYILVVRGPPVLLDDLGQPLGHAGLQLLQVVCRSVSGSTARLALGKIKILFKVVLAC